MSSKEYISDYLPLLEAAEGQERVSQKEAYFIESLRGKYEKNCDATFFSEAQIDWLISIRDR